MTKPPPQTTIEQLLQRLLALREPLTPIVPEPDWRVHAFQWRKQRVLGTDRALLVPVQRIARIDAHDLLGVDHQRDAILRNTEQFVRALPANNVLLTGARGTGKSSL